MKLSYQGIQDKQGYAAAQVALPQYDWAKMAEKTAEKPVAEESRLMWEIFAENDTSHIPEMEKQYEEAKGPQQRMRLALLMRGAKRNSVHTTLRRFARRSRKRRS